MSTKIYTGIRYAGSMNQLLRVLTAFAKDFSQWQRDEIATTIGRVLYRRFDLGTAVSFDTYYDIITDLEKDDQTKWSVSCFPNGRVTYLIFFGPTEAHTRLLKLPGFHEFSYWDNSDYPESMTKAEWDDRRKTWEKMLTGDGKTGVPTNHGFTYEPRFFSFADVSLTKSLAKAPDQMSRAIDLITDGLYRITPGQEFQMTEFRKVHVRVQKALQGEDPELLARINDVAQGLRVLTIKDF